MGRGGGGTCWRSERGTGAIFVCWMRRWYLLRLVLLVGEIRDVSFGGEDCFCWEMERGGRKVNYFF